MGCKTVLEDVRWKAIDDELNDTKASFSICLLTQRIERCYILPVWGLGGFLDVYIVPFKSRAGRCHHIVKTLTIDKVLSTMTSFSSILL